jgi:protein-S-isoprenylcysteine O-methyltransferase Ste14
MSAAAKPKLPPSVTHYGLNMVGVAAALVALYVLRQRHFAGFDGVAIVCAAGVVPIILLDVLVLRVHRRESTGLDWDKPFTPDVRRYLTKLLGLTVTLGPIAFAYYVFPEYGGWYDPFWRVLRRFWLQLVVAALAYVWIVDGQMREPRDVYWQLGRVALFRFQDARRADIANHYRGWLVKAFYIPLFVVYTQNQIGAAITSDVGTLDASNMRLFHYSSDLIYALDVLYATLGYVLSFRLIDTHLRSAEPTILGWAVALECYMPFWGRLFSPQYLHYEGPGFESWLSGHIALRWGWAIAILALEGIYVLATFAFGVRFSNLTHRGILTNGPYRYTKHPAYVAKNLSWWMITLPCIPTHGWQSAVRFSLCLLGVNIIYFLRARTEERHLSRDPAYVQYALWMNEHGVLRFLNRIPFFRYKPPASAPVPEDSGKRPAAAPSPA